MAERVSAAGGKGGLADFRDSDWEDLLLLVRWLPRKAQADGLPAAMRFGRTQLRSKLALLAVARPPTREAAVFRANVGVFFERGPMRLLCEGGPASERFATDFLAVVLREYFEPSVATVFERTVERPEPYRPQLGRETT